MSPSPVSNEEFSVETRESSPANLLMKIESFSLFWKKICELESREFHAGGYNWRMAIYPDGFESERRSDIIIKKEKKSDDDDDEEEEVEEEEEEGGVEEDEHVCVCLSASDTNSLPVDWEINAIFTFFLYSQISDNYLCFQGKSRRFNAMNPKWRFSKLISKKTLMDPSKGYLVEDNCMFGAEVLVIKGPPKVRINECWSLLKDPAAPCTRSWMISPFSKLGEVWNSEEFKVGNHNWIVTIYPKGEGWAKGNHVSIFLTCLDAWSFKPHQRVKAEVVMNLKSKLLRTRHSRAFSHWYNMEIPDRGYADFISINDLKDPNKGFLVHDCFNLEIEITVPVLVV